MKQWTVLAVDIGADIGRIMAVRFDGQRLSLEQVHRFSNAPVEARGTVYWNILNIWAEIQAGRYCP